MYGVEATVTSQRSPAKSEFVGSVSLGYYEVNGREKNGAETLRLREDFRNPRIAIASGVGDEKSLSPWIAVSIERTRT